MKTLSIRQPYAALIACGIKPVENRNWSCSYRGPLLIHASKTLSLGGKEYCREIEKEYGVTLNFGGIVGIAEMVDCVTEHDSSWFGGPHGFVLEEARPLNFLPYKGQLGLFEVDVRRVFPLIVAPSTAVIYTEVRS